MKGASSTLEPRIKQLEEDITKERDCREAIKFTFRSQFTSLYDKLQALQSESADNILWKLTSLRFVFDTAKAFTQPDDATKPLSTQ